MGDTDQPDEGPVVEPTSEGDESVRVHVEPPARAPTRPLVNLAVVGAILAVLLIANGRSADDRSLATSDADAYVELLTATTNGRSAVPDIDGGTVVATAPPTTTPVSAQPPTATSTDVTTLETLAVAVSPDPSVTAPPEATLAAFPPTGEPVTSDGNESVSRVIPEALPPAVAAPVVSPWAERTSVTGAGYVATDVGCASGTSASSLDGFFRDRVGPVIGLDYQHVYPLGGQRYLWLFQDAFVDYTGLATGLGQAAFDHNVAMVQDGACFTLYHRGSISAPTSFEQGTGGNPATKWFWPMGGQTFDGKLYVYWAQMLRDGSDPKGADGLGWHPVGTWLAVYDARTLARLAFQPAANSGVIPIYGYAVDSDDEYTYLFGNTFEQNLQREGGYHNGPHSGTLMFLARVPRGAMGAAPEYRSEDGWSPDPAAATPIVGRYWAENPMQPRRLNGQWVSATKVDGYWGDELSIDVANDPWGPWTTVEQRALSPRGGDPLMNTYHAHLMPWLSGGALVVSVSNNARNMARDAWPKPARYRPMFFQAALVAPPPGDATTTVPEETTTIVEATTTDVATTTTTAPPESTTTAPTTTTTIPASTSSSTTTSSTITSSTTTTVPTSSTTTTTTTTTPPPVSTDPPTSTEPTDPADQSSSTSSTAPPAP